MPLHREVYKKQNTLLYTKTCLLLHTMLRAQTVALSGLFSFKRLVAGFLFADEIPWFAFDVLHHVVQVDVFAIGGSRRTITLGTPKARSNSLLLRLRHAIHNPSVGDL